jgi:hypothetical protein
MFWLVLRSRVVLGIESINLKIYEKSCDKINFNSFCSLGNDDRVTCVVDNSLVAGNRNGLHTSECSKRLFL